MCYQGCEYENQEGECTFSSRRGEKYPCAEFDCIECGKEITRLDLIYNENKCPKCGRKYE